ncbi:hypothetical protein Golomagni_06676, partial [Golovinomyces magnicellulatus]
MAEKKNIVIIGGGIIGSTTAYFLTRHPKFNASLHSITLLEAGPAIASGASGKAGGLLALWAYPACLVPLSYKLHAELAAEHGGAQKWGYRKLTCGSISASVSKDKYDELEKLRVEGKEWEKLPKQDAAAQDLLESTTLPSELDWIDKSVVEGWAEMGAPGRTETSQVHPHHFTTSMAQLAQQAGVDIRTNAQVKNIAQSKAGVEKVEYLDRNTGEMVSLDDITDVVVSAGPWTGRVWPKAKVEGLRAHSVVFDADVSPFAVFTEIALPPNFVPEHRKKLGQSKRHKGLVDPEMYARPFGEVYACGEPDHAEALPETVDLVECDEIQCDDMISYISTISPKLAAAKIKAKQACYLPRHIKFGQETPPVVGKSSIPGVYVAAGHTC